MKTLRSPLILGSFIFGVFPLTGQASTPLPAPDHYRVAYTLIAPVIDGKLDDKAWRNAAFTTPFVQHDTGAAAPTQTRAKILYDNQCLYIGFETDDVDIYAEFNQHQDPLFTRDDLVEIFIDPLGTGKQYIELGISAKGIVYGLQIPTADPNNFVTTVFGIEKIVAASHLAGTLNNPADNDKGWSVELCIPVATLLQAYPKPTPVLQQGTQWRLGLFRIDYDHNTPARKALGFYAWQNHGAFGFHRPERFGVIEFGKQTRP